MEITELDKLIKIAENVSQQLEALQTLQNKLDVMVGVIVGLLITIVIVMGMKYHD